MHFFNLHQSQLCDEIVPIDDSTGVGEGDHPKHLTEADVGKIVNSAVTSQMNRSLPKLLEGALGKIDIAGQIETALQAQKPKETPPVGEQKPGKGKVDDSIQKQFEALTKQVEGEKLARIAAEKATVQAETNQRTSAARAEFRKLVSEKVKPELLDVFVEHVGGKVIGFTDDGHPTLSVRRAHYKGGPEEDMQVSFEDGIADLLASQQSKPFLPAPGGQQGGGGATARKPAQFIPTLPAQNGSNGEFVEPSVEQLEGMGIDIGNLLS